MNKAVGSKKENRSKKVKGPRDFNFPIGHTYVQIIFFILEF